MGLSMQNSSSSAGLSSSSSLAPVPTSSSLMNGGNSGSTTPSMVYASAPSSPNLRNLQYNPSGNAQYNQSSSLYSQPPHQQQHSQYSFHAQQQQPQQQQHSVQSLTSSFYPTSPPHQHQQKSYQQQQQQQAGSSTSFNSMPSAPLRQQPQYAPLVPPLSDAQYAQYHQLLGSAFSSAASTPYHSNQSTPYSSMPTSPTLEYQQLSDPNMIQKPKRRQVKNACVNCQKACKKCDEGRPCTRCIKYGLIDTCVDSTRKIRKKGIKRGPYKRKIPPSQLGSASASTTPVISHAVLVGPPTGYMSEPVTALNSPTQSHMLPFTASASAMGYGYGGNSGSSSGYAGSNSAYAGSSSAYPGSSSSYTFQTQNIDNSYVPPYTTSYSGASLYTAPYAMNDGNNIGSTSNNNNNNNNNNIQLSVLAEARQRSVGIKHLSYDKSSYDLAHASHHRPKREGNKQQHGKSNQGHEHQESAYRTFIAKQKRSSESNHEVDSIVDQSLIAKSDIPCGLGQAVLKCPLASPCCSRWGFCGSGGNYCLDGCQEAFGQCGDIPQQGSQKEEEYNRRKWRPWREVHGFDQNGEPQRVMGQDKSKFRIPSTVPKLPLNGTLVNIAYYAGWAQYRGLGETTCRQRPYLPSAIPWSSLDYVMFAFAYFDDDNELYPADPSDERLYFSINKLKMATKTRVMISIGGWTFTHPDSRSKSGTKHRFRNMVRSPKSRKAFIASCIEYCQSYGFDGVDIDYEYPAYQDRAFVTALFREMREAFDAEGSGLIISMAGAAFKDGVQGFELDKVAKYMDFLMIMTYDLYGSDDSNRVVNIHTALIQMPDEKHSGHSVQGAVELYLDRGVPREKIVLGLALYAKTFVLANPSNTQPGIAQFKQGGDPTNCMDSRGEMAYNEIAYLIHPADHTSRQVSPLWDPDGRVFYFVYGSRQDNLVGYDDRPSLDLKLQLVTELKLAGVMWWSLDQDLDSTSEKPDKAKLSPSLYFYGELEFVRTARDRDIRQAYQAGEGPPRATSQLIAQVESKRPEYITQYLKLSKVLRLMAEVKGLKGLKVKKRLVRSGSVAIKRKMVKRSRKAKQQRHAKGKLTSHLCERQDSTAVNT
ncbi:hypothetical protein BGZ54_003633 [Gamsiella multidivaricata]|nr:hypothetical protein BGZ54_003633 [Gamsiella multidivaricata]